METDNKDDLFSIRLNSEGIDSIFRFAKAVKVYLIVGIIFTGLALVQDVLMLFDSQTRSGDLFLTIYFGAYPFLSIGATVVFIFQLVYFNKLSDSLREAIHNTNENIFNAGLKYLVAAARSAMIITCFSIVFVILNLVFTFLFRL